METADRVAREGRALARELAANQATLDNRVEALELLVGRGPSALPGDRMGTKRRSA